MRTHFIVPYKLLKLNIFRTTEFLVYKNVNINGDNNRSNVIKSYKKSNTNHIVRSICLFICIFSTIISTPQIARASYWYTYPSPGQMVTGDDPCSLAQMQAYVSFMPFSSNLEFKGCYYSQPDMVTALLVGNTNYLGFAILECTASTGDTKVNHSCVHADDPGPKKVCYSDPVDVLSGENIEYVSDFSTPGPYRLSFERYNTRNGRPSVSLSQFSSLGSGWRSNFDSQAEISGSVFLAVLPTGRELAFASNGTNWSLAYLTNGNYYPSRKGGAERLVAVGSTFELTTADDVTYVYDASSGDSRTRLMQIRFRGGYVQTLAYAAPADRRPLSVTDSLNRTLSFAYDSQMHISDVTFNSAVVAHFDYKGVGDTTVLAPYFPNGVPEDFKKGVAVIESVKYSSSEKTIYYYEDTNNKFALTGQTSNDGVRYSTWAYDAAGRAVSSSHPSNSETTTFSYAPASKQITITNPLGKQEVVTYSVSASNNMLPVSVLGQASTHCPMSNKTFTYDANDFLATETDEEGRVTAYVNETRGHPTSITRGYGTPQATTTTMSWHATWNVPTQVVEPGLTTDLTWNTAGQLTQVKQTDTTTQSVPFSTAGRTRTWTYTYATGGGLASVDGPLAGTGDTTSYTYNANGYLATTTNEMSHVTTVTAWNTRGQPTSVTDSNGTITTYAYDAMGRLTGITLSPGASQTAWTMTYTGAGDLATLQEPTGATYTLTWDAARRLSKIQNNGGETITYTRDAMGNVTFREIKGADASTMFQQTDSFDELGRLIQRVGGEGRTWKFGYDKTANLTGVTDPRTKSLSYGYDAVSRLITETERDTGVVTHGYNGKDEETSYKDPRNLSTVYVRNGFGEVIQEASPDRGTSVYDYDARGLMISKKDARNVTATYTYDNAGRLKTRSYPTTALNETFTYDAISGGNAGKSRLTSNTDSAGSTSYSYDAKGQLVREVRTISTYAHTTSYTYDAAGHLTQMTYPSGRIVIYGYDGLGRINYVGLKRSASATEEVIAWWAGYFPFGDVRGLTLANGLNMWSNWDWEYRPDGLFLDQASGGTSLVQRYHYIGDGMNLTVLNNNNLAPAESQSFGYDDAGRMTSASGPYGSRSWTYDKVGNRLSESKTVGTTTTSQAYAYPSTSNRLASVTQAGTAVRSFTYDAAGNTTGDTRSGTAYAYTINDAGRISQLKIGGTVKANYAYDARNRLSIRQTLNMTPAGTTHLIHDKDDRVIVETNGTGTAVREYVWLGDMPLAVLDGSSSPTNPTLLWVHVDHLKRPELMTDARKAVKWKALYEPFGAVQSITGAAANQMRFPGQWFQLEAGLHYNWWRHYDPTTGRYAQPDPLGLSQGPEARTGATFQVPIGTPGSSLWSAAGLVGADTGGQTGLLAGLAMLTQDGRQAPVGLGTEFATNSAKTSLRDGPSLFGYVRQSPGMRTDASGLAGDGTPGNNRTQNKQVDDVCRILKLNKDQRQQLHREISGQNCSFPEILQIAKDLFCQ